MKALKCFGLFVITLLMVSSSFAATVGVSWESNLYPNPVRPDQDLKMDVRAKNISQYWPNYYCNFECKIVNVGGQTVDSFTKTYVPSGVGVTEPFTFWTVPGLTWSGTYYLQVTTRHYHNGSLVRTQSMNTKSFTVDGYD